MEAPSRLAGLMKDKINQQEGFPDAGKPSCCVCSVRFTLLCETERYNLLFRILHPVH